MAYRFDAPGRPTGVSAQRVLAALRMKRPSRIVARMFSTILEHIQQNMLRDGRGEGLPYN